jgi:hypothetical protein
VGLVGFAVKVEGKRLAPRIAVNDDQHAVRVGAATALCVEIMLAASKRIDWRSRGGIRLAADRRGPLGLHS